MAYQQVSLTPSDQRKMQRFLATEAASTAISRRCTRAQDHRLTLKNWFSATTDASSNKAAGGIGLHNVHDSKSQLYLLVIRVVVNCKLTASPYF